MLKYPLLILAMVLTVRASSQDAQSTILQIMERQQECWNHGDIPCFMNGYWESDSLMFVSKEKVYYGYQNTLERYYNSYPNREAMGKLTFTFISLQPLGEEAFYVVGSYHLERTIGDAQGHFYSALEANRGGMGDRCRSQ